MLESIQLGSSISKSAIKIYAELDNNGNLPCLIRITEGNISDIKAAKKYINIIKDSIYVFDKVYHDVQWFKHIADNGGFFVTRMKEKTKFKCA